MGSSRVTAVAPDVRQVTVGKPVSSHVYLIDTEEGVVAFDAAIKGAGDEILAAAGGRIAKVVLSHSHADHRGAAAELGAPIFCHPDEVDDAEGDAGRRYIDFGRVRNPDVRELIERLNAAWDGGPVTIAGTVAEGDTVGDFRVIHVPGHAPGQIALWREADRLLLLADSVYTLDFETGRPTPARVPHVAVNWDSDMARASIARLAELGPLTAWAGHSRHVSENAQRELRAAAEPR